MHNNLVVAQKLKARIGRRGRKQSSRYLCTGQRIVFALSVSLFWDHYLSDCVRFHVNSFSHALAQAGHRHVLSVSWATARGLWSKQRPPANCGQISDQTAVRLRGQSSTRIAKSTEQNREIHRLKNLWQTKISSCNRLVVLLLEQY